jgi:hypothetical protein
VSPLFIHLWYIFPFPFPSFFLFPSFFGFRVPAVAAGQYMSENAACAVKGIRDAPYRFMLWLIISFSSFLFFAFCMVALRYAIFYVMRTSSSLLDFHSPFLIFPLRTHRVRYPIALIPSPSSFHPSALLLHYHLSLSLFLPFSFSALLFLCPSLLCLILSSPLLSLTLTAPHQ